MSNFSDFELHYAFSMASALFADYLRRNPSLSPEEKASVFREFVEGALTEAKLFTADLQS